MKPALQKTKMSATAVYNDQEGHYSEVKDVKIHVPKR